MNRIALSSLMLAGIAAVAAGSLVIAQDASKLSGRIKVDGSSTVGPITTAVAEEFKAVAPNIDITVGISGTGGGFKRFSTGETDISNASRPIKKEVADAA